MILFTGARLHDDPALIGKRLDQAAEGHEPVLLRHGKCNPRRLDPETGPPVFNPRTGKPEVVPWNVALAHPEWSYVGADWHAHQHAVMRGWTTEAHPAAWNVHPRAAGNFRNQRMVSLGANVCVGAPLGGSKDSPGTRDCMARARRAGIPVIDISLPPEPEGLW